MNPRIPILAFLSLVPVPQAQAGDSPAKIPAPLAHQHDVKLPPAAPQGPQWTAPELAGRAPGAAAPIEAEAEHAQAVAKARAAGLPRLRPDHQRLYWDEPGDGHLWVRGGNFKARFSAQGTSFTPFLGSDAPRNFPLELALERVTRGATPLPLAAPELARTEDGVRIGHGALDEVWHASVAGLEQTFVFDALAGSGDLVLDVAATSELAGAADCGGGLVFTNELGAVSYSRATAIDAAGRTLPLATTLEAGSIEIRVPAEWLASAVLPLTIDPMVGSAAVTTAPAIDLAPDIASDGINLHYLVVMEEVFSSTDTDVYSVVTDLGGVPDGSSWQTIDYTSDSWFLPKVAFNALNQTFLVAAQVRPFGSTDPIVRARAEVSPTHALYPQQTISGAEPGHKFYVDVGGDPVLVGPTYFLVVWTRNFAANDWDIHARLVGFDGTPQGSSVIYLENSGATMDWHPRISKTDGREPFATQTWNVTWMRTQGAGYTDTLAAQVRWDGTIVTTTFNVTSGFDALYPVASSPLEDSGFGGVRPFGVAWHAGGGTNHDVFLAALSGMSLGAAVNFNQLEGDDLTQDQLYPELDTDGARFALAYCESYNHTSDLDAYVGSTLYTPGNLQLLEAHQLVDFSGATTDTTRIAGLFVPVFSGRYFPYFGLTWNEYTSSSDGDVFAGTYRLPDQVTSFCAGNGSAGSCPCSNNLGSASDGCPNSASSVGGGLYWNSGSPIVSSDSLVIAAMNLPATAPCIFLQGSSAAGAGTPFGDGLRCIGGTLIRLATKAASAGIATYPQGGDLSISVRGSVPAYGGARSYQVWYRDPNPTYCTAFTYNITSALAVLWLP